MVRAKPNETRLAGTVREVRRAGRKGDAVDLVVAVERADEIEGCANLLADTPGQELTVTVDAEDVAEADVQPGRRIVLGAELRGPGAVWSRPKSLRAD
jgi:hypothetical protein